jgi:hypothetical protein
MTVWRSVGGEEGVEVPVSVPEEEGVEVPVPVPEEEGEMKEERLGGGEDDD